MSDRAVDVVVVGAGPTGLTVATELALAGVRVVVTERALEPNLAPKAGGMGALASEVLERRGLGAALDAEERAAVAATKVMKSSLGAVDGAPARGPRRPGGHYAGLSLIDQDAQREPDRRMRPIPQEGLERVLNEHARALGVEVLRGHTVESFEDTDEHVRIETRGPSGRATFAAAFLVGCDGGRSTVRKNGGFDFLGTDPTLIGRQALVELDFPERLLPLGWRRTEHGMLSFWPWPSSPNAGRVTVIEFDPTPQDRDAPVTVSEFEDSLRRVSEVDVHVTAMQAAARWTDNARQASSYQRGRVLLAGDAAHVHSPFGGQGLNLGLVDAANLGWKLAATVQGRAPLGLLDTYTKERHPAAARALESTRAQVTIMRPGPQATAMRGVIADLLTHYPDVNRYFGEMVSGVATRYDLGDDDSRVGSLVGDFELTVEGVRTRSYPLMHDGRALLVDGSSDGAAAALGEPWRSRVKMVTSPGADSLLIRPDGCIAWAGRPGGLLPALERWFGAP